MNNLKEIETIENSTTLFGFWMYLMSDLVLFAALFAVLVVLRGSPEGTGAGLSMTTAFIETLLLLTSSFTCGLALLSARANKKTLVLTFLAITFLLGASFIYLEVSEFARLTSLGLTPQHSGYMSAFFTLVGTHGLHVTVALVWMLALWLAVAYRGLTQSNLRKLTLLAYFWHFLDIIWIFIFTIVYLLALL